MKVLTVFFDLETGGTEDRHPDIQLAAAAVKDWEVIETFERKIAFDPRHADPMALEMNSYEPILWREESIPELEVVEDFGEFLRRHAAIRKMSKRQRPYYVARLAGHNARTFDAPRLLRMFQRHDRFLAAEVFLPLDTLQLALWHFAHVETDKRPSDFKLPTLCRFFGIDPAGAHDALADVLNLVQLTRCLVDGKEMT